MLGPVSQVLSSCPVVLANGTCGTGCCGLARDRTGPCKVTSCMTGRCGTGCAVWGDMLPTRQDAAESLHEQLSLPACPVWSVTPGDVGSVVLAWSGRAGVWTRQSKEAPGSLSKSGPVSPPKTMAWPPCHPAQPPPPPHPMGSNGGSVSVNKSMLCRQVNLRGSLSSLERWPPGLTSHGSKIAIAVSVVNIKITH